MTRDEALGLKIGQTIYHKINRNADGTPQRWRVNGQIKRWKTRPDDFRIPVKWGLKTGDYLVPSNIHLVEINEEDAI